MVKRKVKGELAIPSWIIDGFVGIIALMIYNFLLYFFTSIRIYGIIAEMENAMGYFGINSFIDLGFNLIETLVGILSFFVISFLLGVYVGKYVRRKRKK
jgi:hypothetical protein